jgi:hypothetical protein
LEVKEEKDIPDEDLSGNIEGKNLGTPIFVSFSTLLCFPVMVL